MMCSCFSWRVQLMEKGIEQIDFETVDSTVQVHGGYNDKLVKSLDMPFVNIL